MPFEQVVVMKKCDSDVQYRKCLGLILEDIDDIDAAVVSPLPWTSPPLLRQDAIDFAACINDPRCGGAATIEHLPAEQ